MARGREPLGPTPYVVKSDASCLIMYIHVSQTMGVHGAVTWSEHEGRDDATERVMSRFRGDSKDASYPALIASLRSLLDTAEKVYALERERQSSSN